ncbi:hypothetical protein DSLASN_08960 [Desulfoluna limicola]|uniref:Uncharacterized protein n=1 Tax=Desulfoluna limicola TaxID=2810562 RepID=A0ABN6EZY8_9BACT|nr:hypothetical protein [Desulfoluna limicola]BCS95264.1 hypothetical protein DSLASN_08960 [Desulfoluna limicola]
MNGRKQRIHFLPALVMCVCLFLNASMVSVNAQTNVGGNVTAYVNEAAGTWYTGTIDAIDDVRVCVADVNHWFAYDVIFVSRYGFQVTQRSFYEGKKVKVLLGSDYKCSIVMEI